MMSNDELDKRLSLLEQKLDLVLQNHLHHMEKDIAMLKNIVGVTSLAVFVQLLTIILGMLNAS